MSSESVGENPQAAYTGELPEEVRAIVAGMRFPMLLLGGLYSLVSLGALALGGLTFMGGLSTPLDADQQRMVQGIGAIQALTAGVALVPAALLVRAGIAALSAHESDQAVAALRVQLWFWRILALYVLGGTVLYAVVGLLSVGLGLLWLA